MNKLSKKIEDLKGWTKEHKTEILACGVAGLTIVGGVIICHKSHKLGKAPWIDNTDKVSKAVGVIEDAQGDTTVDILTVNKLELSKAGEIGKMILKQHPELSPDEIIDYSIVYTTDDWQD